jgi:Mechanosensitive ion channel
VVRSWLHLRHAARPHPPLRPRCRKQRSRPPPADCIRRHCHHWRAALDLRDPRISHYGSGLLASAGVASLILATAAKSTAANLLAGIQIAFTEPIRLDDDVVIQGEWGRIEEINSAYVVVKIWDLRRLVLPLNYFIENSFQNWTRESADIMGMAFLYVDYSIPVAELRQQLDRIVHASPLWNKQVCGLQVTNLTEHTMEIRCLMSSRNSGENFDLRCLVREQMTAFIQQNYPNAFPTTRFAGVSELPMQPPSGTPSVSS